MMLAQAAQAAPVGGQVTSGAGNISQSGATTNIAQNSQNLSLNWQSFNIAANETVNFQQPNASAIAVNRIAGSASQIFGHLNANGQVYLINPNGILFGAGSQVNVGGLVASTLDVDDASLNNASRNFSGTGSGSIINQGAITAANGGYVALLGNQVSNQGAITATLGTVAMAAGSAATLTFNGNQLLHLQVTQNTLNNLVENKQLVSANGGQVIMTAGAKDAVLASVVNNSGIIEAQTVSNQNGTVTLAGGYVTNSGTIDASGGASGSGGSVTADTRAYVQSGTVTTNGTGNGKGGTIHIHADKTIIQTAGSVTSANGANAQGGNVSLQSDVDNFTSGLIAATGTLGGVIDVLGDNVTLAAAQLDASGQTQGGQIRVGGDFHGANPAIQNATTTTVTGPTTIKADGGNGSVVVWSNQQTGFYGSISAQDSGSQNGGTVEVSSQGNLNFGGNVNTGVGGSLLLDPTNITISNSGGPAVTQFLDPDAAAGNSFGSNVIALSTGNFVVTSPNDSLAASNAGAVYLFNGTTGGLISALTGSNAGDQVGANNITLVGNGNYVVSSLNWNNQAGAVTWGSGTTGVSGIVSASNSLIGSNPGDQVGYYGVTLLSSGNYLVSSPNWNNQAGAVTWGSGATGVSGAVSASNSLIGSSSGDQIGTNITLLTTNGNYVINSPNWNSQTGAATWGNGTTGVSGIISASNSLIGSNPGDQVGFSVTALTNGNYVVNSFLWNNQTGAATWGSGTTGVSGTISASNSLIGSNPGDYVGQNNIYALPNGNYVVSSPYWLDGAGGGGADTWGNGNSGISGYISSNNSLIDNGSTQSITVLPNSNYLVSAPYWNGVGAVTFANGTTGATGIVSASNSLVGGNSGDLIGYVSSFAGIQILANNNYVVYDRYWNNQTGSVTWGSGTTGISGVVSASNSLIGSNSGDWVGDNGITALPNGNYLVHSPDWNNQASALTWGSGTAGVSGVVSASNSLVGSNPGDLVGRSITILTNGNYVVSSPFWNGNRGAVTWGSGTAGVSGVVSASNSLVGSNSGDYVGALVTGGFFGGVYSNITALNNGNYLVGSSSWNNNTGAATWGSGTAGVSGTVSASNSLIGSNTGDQVGLYFTSLTNGNYLVDSLFWNSNAGAVTWGSGTAGISGTISASNSLIGSNSGDYVGGNVSSFFGQTLSSTNISALANGNYVVGSVNWNNATGAATWGNGTTGISGVVSASNSLVGSNAGDQVGDHIIALTNGNYVVGSYHWNSQAGAATWGNGLYGVTGTISASNSLIGSNPGDQVSGGGNITTLTNGNYLVGSGNWNNNMGAVTWGDGLSGVTGMVSASNSLVGSNSGDQVGNNGIIPLTNGNYIVSTTSFNSNAGQVLLGTPGNLGFAQNQGQDVTLNPAQLTSILATNSAVTLQASNDLTVSDAITVPGAIGGALILQAGRNLAINANITTANGNLTAVAGATGADPSYTSAGTPTLTIGNGVAINAGSGNITLAANGGNFVNNSGSTTPLTANRWLVYSTQPGNNTASGLTADFSYGLCSFGSGCANNTIPGSGNGFLYSSTISTPVVSPPVTTPPVTPPPAAAAPVITSSPAVASRESLPVAVNTSSFLQAIFTSPVMSANSFSPVNTMGSSSGGSGPVAGFSAAPTTTSASATDDRASTKSDSPAYDNPPHIAMNFASSPAYNGFPLQVIGDGIRLPAGKDNPMITPVAPVSDSRLNP